VKPFTNWSIRTHLLLLVIIAVTPALTIILYTGIEQKKNSIGEAHIKCSTLISAFAGDMEDTVNSTRQMLTTLAVLPDVRNRNSEACNILFKQILTNDKRYLNLQEFQPTGESIASVLLPPPGLNVSDRKYFRDAIKHRSFAAGEYIVGRTVRQPTFNLAYPVIDAQGELRAVIQAAIDLGRVSQLFDKSLFPTGSTMVLLDHKGTVLFHTSNPDKLIGTKEDKALFGEMVAARDKETVTSRRSGDSNRIMAYKSLRLPGEDTPYMYIRLEVPEETVLSQANFVLARNLWFMVIAACLAAVAAFVYAHLGILNRTSRLVHSSELLASGNFDVKAGIPYSAGEFGLIAQAFDQMSENLALRDAERAAFIQELQNATSWALDEKAKTEAIIAGIGDGISIQDRNYRILYQNDIHKNLLGDLTGRLCYEVYENDSQRCPDCPVHRSFEDGQVHTTEKMLIIEGKHHYLLITASPLLDSTGEIIGGITLVKNITERKLTEIEQENLNRKLEESNRDLQQFAYVASHDLQEPLRTITSFIQLLARRYKGKLDQNADEFIAFITDGATRMQQLINDLLAYSRVDSKNSGFTAFDAEAAIGNTLANLKTALAESGAEVTHSQLSMLVGDATQFSQLLQNLIGNAIKFRGDKVPRIHISCTERPGEWEIDVKDNGIGIEPQYYDRIFDIFQRLHARNDYAGTGIGLAVCKKIVERHGGRIWVVSEPGNGSTFSFTIRKMNGEGA
jgi:signal transduction histidine kinase